MKRLLTSCFGLGLLPTAPGTWGSLPPVVAYAVLCHLDYELAAGIMMAVFVAAGSLVCILFAPSVIAATGQQDPGEVVADEFAGQALAYFIVNFLTMEKVCASVILTFLLFRVFDIVKPWPCRRLEKLGAGWGILTDDLMAGVYAAAAVALFVWIRGWW